MFPKLNILLVILPFVVGACAKKNLFEPTELIETGDKVVSPPAGFHPFYKKYINANGIPITGSEKVRDSAFIRARHTVINMLAKRPDVLTQMILRNARIGIIADEEEPTDLPEYANVEDPAAFNARGRAYGGTPDEPFATCAEENLMRVGDTPPDGTRADKWHGEDILVHEFTHLIHQVGLIHAYAGFQAKLVELYNNAKSQGLWQNTYAITNEYEYFAECVQSWYNTNLEGPVVGNGVHNHVDTRAELKTYDPQVYQFLEAIFHNNNWQPDGF